MHLKTRFSFSMWKFTNNSIPVDSLFLLIFRSVQSQSIFYYIGFVASGLVRLRYKLWFLFSFSLPVEGVFILSVLEFLPCFMIISIYFITTISCNEVPQSPIVRICHTPETCESKQCKVQTLTIQLIRKSKSYEYMFYKGRRLNAVLLAI